MTPEVKQLYVNTVKGTVICAAIAILQMKADMFAVYLFGWMLGTAIGVLMTHGRV